MSLDGPEGQLHTLGLLEQLRAACSGYRENSSALYYKLDRLLMELANPNLHDIPGNFQNRVELWIGREYICAGSSQPLEMSR